MPRSPGAPRQPDRVRAATGRAHDLHRPAARASAWRLVVDKSSTQLYDYVIDANTGDVLHRENTVEFATGLAWDYFPGPLPFNNSGVAMSRDFTAPGWLASNATTLSGNNAHAYFDLLDDNTPGGGRRGPAGRAAATGTTR